MDIVAITVCVNFSDILKHILPQNKKFFKSWYIVTSPDDRDTQALIQTVNADNVHILIYDNFYKNAIFNKGGAIRHAQEYVHTYESAHAILLIDADICLPDNFMNKMVRPNPNTLYGVRNRLFYNTDEDFIHKVNAYESRTPADFCGFFQLYAPDTQYLYVNSMTCGKCDMLFKDLFPIQIKLDIYVHHFGVEGLHWNGRVNLDTFKQTNSVQIVVISESESKKQKMLQQFSELEIPYPVYFLSASTPHNSASYLPDGCDEDNAKKICTARSHCRAIEYAYRKTSADITLIMEDTVALHKHNFLPVVQDLLEDWYKYTGTDSMMISLGWRPVNHRSHYDRIPMYKQKNLKSIPNHKVLFYLAYGLQAYAIHKSNVNIAKNIIIHDTHAELKQTIRSLNHEHISKDSSITGADEWLNRLFVQSIVSPPVVIERNEGATPFAEDYFKGNESEKKNYWSY